MAEARQCERCRGFYLVKSKDKIAKITLTNDSCTGIYGRHDLCDDCIRKLDLFLSGKELVVDLED